LQRGLRFAAELQPSHLLAHRGRRLLCVAPLVITRLGVIRHLHQLAPCGREFTAVLLAQLRMPSQHLLRAFDRELKPLTPALWTRLLAL
jgi:hypothetical protein